MPLTVSSDTNLSDYLDVCNSTFDMSNGIKNLFVSPNKPYKTNDVLEFRVKNHTLKVGIKLRIGSYNSETGEITTNAVIGYSDDIPVATMYFDGSTSGSYHTNTNPGLNLIPGDSIRVARFGTPANYLTGTVSSYNNDTGALIISVIEASGSAYYSDLVLVPDGSFSEWDVTYPQSDTINITGNSVLTIDSNNVVPLHYITSTDRGTVLIKNTSTSELLIVEFSMYSTSSIAVQQNSKLIIEGDWLTVGQGYGTLPQSFDLSSYNIFFPTFLEVETFNGSNVYEKWSIVTDGFTGDEFGFNGYIPQKNWGTGEMGNVFFFDFENKVLKTGDGVNGNLVPVGAKVRMPNIYIKRRTPFSYVHSTNTETETGSVLNVVDCRYFSTSTNGWTGFINGECITGTSRSSAGSLVNITNRGYYGTYAQPINPGDKLNRRLIAATSGVEVAGRIFTDPSGSVYADKVQFYNIYLYLNNALHVDLKNFGTDLSLWCGNSTGNYYIDNFYAAQSQNISNRGIHAENVKGDISFTNVLLTVSVLTYQPTSAVSDLPIYFYRCSSIEKLEHITTISFGSTTTRSGGVYISASSTKDVDYEINNLKLIGGYVYLLNSFDIKFRDLYFGLSPAPEPKLDATSCYGNLDTDEFTVGTTWNPTNTVPETGSIVKFISGTYPSASPGISNGSFRFIIKTSETTFKIARSYRDAMNGVYQDLLTNGGTNVRIQCEQEIGSLLNIANSSNVRVNRVYSIGGAGFVNYLVYLDPASKNVEIYNIDYDSNYGMTYLFANEGQGLYLKNAKLYQIRPQNLLGTAGGIAGGLTNAVRTGIDTYISNVKADSDFTLDWNSYIDVNNYGVGYTSNSYYNFVPGFNAHYYTTSTANNMKNVGPFYNLLDPGMNATTGTLAICSFTETENLVLTGNAYLSNTGKLYTLNVGDSATITSSTLIRGIVSFQDVDPTHIASTTASTIYDFEFRIRTPLGEWTEWAFLTGAELSIALQNLPNYNSNVGFMFSVKITAKQDVSRIYYTGRIFTNIDPEWVASDAYFQVEGVAANEILEVRKKQDDVVIYRTTGSGRVDIPSVYEVYFLRKSFNEVIIASTIFESVIPTIGDNGVVQLYSGSEIQVANPDSIPGRVWTYEMNGRTVDQIIQDIDTNAEIASIS